MHWGVTAGESEFEEGVVLWPTEGINDGNPSRAFIHSHTHPTGLRPVVGGGGKGCGRHCAFLISHAWGTEVFQQTRAQMWFAYAFKFWHKRDILWRLHLTKSVTMRCENLSVKTSISISLFTVFERPILTLKTKYWTSMFVTAMFDLRLCNSYMWPNQF